MTDLAPESEPAAVGDSNAQAYSVSELAFALKRTIEDVYGFVRLRGELSKSPSTATATSISTSRTSAPRSPGDLEGQYPVAERAARDRLEVIVTGKVTTYPGRSQYQIIIETMAPAGVGALLAQLERLKARLADEGLFEAARPNGPALHAAGDRRHHQPHRRGDPRHPAPHPRPLALPGDRLAGGGPGDQAAARCAPPSRGSTPCRPTVPIPRPDC